jgi:hypothetical protein
VVIGLLSLALSACGGDAPRDVAPQLEPTLLPAEPAPARVALVLSSCGAWHNWA